MARVGGEVHKFQKEAHIKTSKNIWQRFSRGGLPISSKHVYVAATKVSPTSPCETEETWWKGLARPQYQWTELRHKSPEEREGGRPV